jgi:hypothetical protein
MNMKKKSNWLAVLELGAFTLLMLFIPMLFIPWQTILVELSQVETPKWFLWALRFFLGAFYLALLLLTPRTSFYAVLIKLGGGVALLGVFMNVAGTINASLLHSTASLSNAVLGIGQACIALGALAVTGALGRILQMAHSAKEKGRVIRPERVEELAAGRPLREHKRFPKS